MAQNDERKALTHAQLWLGLIATCIVILGPLLATYISLANRLTSVETKLDIYIPANEKEHQEIKNTIGKLSEKIDRNYRRADAVTEKYQ